MPHYIIVKDKVYYTGDTRIPVSPWTPHRKFAKVYVKRAWAQKAADKWNGQVVVVNR